MNFIESIKLFFGNYFFKKEFENLKRDVIVNNIENATSVGLIFNADSEENYRIISRFALHLKKEGVKEIKMLGFFNEKNLPAYLSPKLGQDFILRKDLNWHLKPISTQAMNFIYEPFDILIDLTMEEIFPLKYILGMSRAHFKAGRGDDKKNLYLDLILNTEKEKGTEELAKQILHYLKQINKVDGDVLAMLK